MREYDYIVSRKRNGALRNILAVRGIILRLIRARSYAIVRGLFAGVSVP